MVNTTMCSTPGHPLSFDMGAGHFGVELFFIISGFVILMTIERRKTVRDFAVHGRTRATE